MKLTQHPLSAVFPAMQADEYQIFKDSIEIIGVVNPITMCNGMVLDGWHRYTAATELGMDCLTVELADDVDPRDFVLAQNKARRNLSASQRAAATTAVYAWFATNGVNQHTVKTGGEPGSPPPKTNAEMAAIARTTSRTIQHAKAYQMGAVQEVQEAVKTGAISVKIAAAVAKLPAKEQKQLAANGPDAMRAATRTTAKAALKSGQGAKTTVQVHQTQAQAKAEQVAEDAHGDTDPVLMWEAAEKKIIELQKELDAANADDAKAEILKFKRIADLANRRQNELMDTVNSREKELRRMSNILRRISKAAGENDQRKLAGIVEAKFRDEEGEVCHAPQS